MKSPQILLRKTKRDPDIPRGFYVNNITPPSVVDPNIALQYKKFATNTVKTSSYTVWNFLPKNLFEQFRRIANFYFLCLCIIHFSVNSPVSPFTTLLPLVFVVTVTAIKQGYEDWKRHMEDNSVNKRQSKVFQNGTLQDIEQSNIKVGDVVKVVSDEEFPCDLLLLVSANQKQQCDVTTANLDGETYLKTFHCPFSEDDFLAEQNVGNFSGLIQCQHPQPNLYDFKGRLDTNSENQKSKKTFSLSTEHLLLRGARLKNTEYIYGVAVYTGKESKMVLNLKLKSSKFSTAERACNNFLLCNMVILILELGVVALSKWSLGGYKKFDMMWYLVPSDIDGGAKAVLQEVFAYFITFSYIIPISLYVTLELQKFLGSFFFQWDEEMRNSETREFAICNTSDLNEELGQVEYLFTDKTGTLTENSMRFCQCSVAGVKFAEKDLKCLLRIDNESVGIIPQDIDKLVESFLMTLALCHTVQAKEGFGDQNGEPNKHCYVNKMGFEETEESIPLSKKKLEYFASSPDEKALVEACARYGIVYQGEKDGCIELEVHQKKKLFTLLETLEFDSDRKMMSVIVQDNKDEQLWLLSKGAESSILKKCLFSTHEERKLREITMGHINDFARLGLRTLAIARRKMTEEEFTNMSKKLELAKQEIKNRDSDLRSVMEEIETGFSLLGATGVEDLLQDGVQETLESFAVAGIKVWVLTGDKIETAVNIAYLAGLFKRFTSLVYLTHMNELATTKLELQKNEMQFKDAKSNIGLVVDGTSLILLLEEFREIFFRICSQCSAVICCRMTPKQKAEIVRLVKSCTSKRTVCAAVGDGANDVSMIQEAHVGIGIMGKEGRQAVRSSDFAVGRFRFLQRALLVHGHWYYTRVATLILYSFYKNVAFVTPQIFFAFQSAFSTMSVYEGFALTLFNTVFTALPVIAYGLFEQGYREKKLLSRPYLYKEIRNNNNLSWKFFIIWTVIGFWHASVLYYGLKGATHNSGYVIEGMNQDLYLFGMVLTTNAVLICNLKLMIESRYQTWIFFGIILFTLVTFYICYLLYCGLYVTHEIFWTFYVMHRTPMFYLSSILLITTCLLPDIFIQVFRTTKLKSQKAHLFTHF